MLCYGRLLYGVFQCPVWLELHSPLSLRTRYQNCSLVAALLPVRWTPFLPTSSKPYLPLYHIYGSVSGLWHGEPAHPAIRTLVGPWLPAQIKFISLMLAYRGTSGSAPIHLNSTIQAYAPSWPLLSSKEHRLALPSLHTRQSLKDSSLPREPSFLTPLTP